MTILLTVARDEELSSAKRKERYGQGGWRRGGSTASGHRDSGGNYCRGVTTPSRKRRLGVRPATLALALLLPEFPPPPEPENGKLPPTCVVITLKFSDKENVDGGFFFFFPSPSFFPFFFYVLFPRSRSKFIGEST